MKYLNHKSLFLFMLLTLIGKSGISQSDATWALSPEYFKIAGYNDKFVLAQKKYKGHYAVINYSGDVVFKFNKNEIPLEYEVQYGAPIDLYVIKSKDKAALFDLKKLKYISKYEFEDFGLDQFELRDSMIQIFHKGETGRMDRQGNILCPPTKEKCYANSEIVIKQKVDRLEVTYDGSNYEILGDFAYWVVNQEYKYIELVKKDSLGAEYHNYFRGHVKGVYVQEDRKAGFKTKTGIVGFDGTTIIPFDHNSVSEWGDMFIVSEAKNVGQYGQAIGDDRRYGLVNLKNEVLLPTEYKRILRHANNIFFVVDENDLWGAFDVDTETFVIDVSYGYYAHVQVELNSERWTTEPRILKLEMYEVLVDSIDEVLIPKHYSGIFSTTHPDIYGVIGQSSKYPEEEYIGYYNIDLGKEIVPTDFSDRCGFGGYFGTGDPEIISVVDPETTKTGFYTLDGHKISDPIFPYDVMGFSEGFAPVYKERRRNLLNNYYLIDENGDRPFKDHFIELSFFRDGLALARTLKGKHGILKRP